MDDLISRQAAMNAIREISPAFFSAYRHEIYIDKQEVLARLKLLPSVNPEQKKGKWIGKPIAGYSTVRCSVCNDVFRENEGRWNFCPNCGAEMEKENDDR